MNSLRDLGINFGEDVDRMINNMKLDMERIEVRNKMNKVLEDVKEINKDSYVEDMMDEFCKCRVCGYYSNCDKIVDLERKDWCDSYECCFNCYNNKNVGGKYVFKGNYSDCNGYFLKKSWKISCANFCGKCNDYDYKVNKYDLTEIDESLGVVCEGCC